MMHELTKEEKYQIAQKEFFLAENLRDAVCYLAGFKDENVKIEELPQKWIFDSEHELGDFIYKIARHDSFQELKKTRSMKPLKGCRDILGIKHKETK